jgi:hypothetical protein
MAELDDAAMAFSLLNHTELNGQRISIEPTLHPQTAALE